MLTSYTSSKITHLKGNDCPVCNGDRPDCRSSGELIHCYSHNDPPAGYEPKGMSAIGASLYAPTKAVVNGFDYAANREARLAKQARQQQQVINARREFDALPTLEERDRQIRSYPQKLNQVPKQDLLLRDLHQDEINLALSQHWLFGAKDGYGIAAYDPISGLFCGAQKARDDRSPKYDWSILAGRNKLKETGENPLFVRVSPNFDSSKPYENRYCEGSLKSLIRALQEWRTNPQIIVVGAAGGVFGKKSLERILGAFPDAKSHTLLPDADSQNVKKLNIYKGYGDLAAAIPLIKFADWGQWHDKAKGDCDEVYGTGAFDNYQLRSPKAWLDYFDFEKNVKLARQHLEISDRLTHDIEITQDEFRALDFDTLMKLTNGFRDIFIKAATGVGKTELAAKIVAMFTHAIAPFHRRSLAQSGSIRLGLTYRTDCASTGNEFRDRDGAVNKIGFCNEAIFDIRNKIDSLLNEEPIAFGDEFDHQLESLALSSTHGKDGRRRIHTDTFWQIFTRSIKSLVTSADITDFEVNQFHKKTGRKPFVIRVTPVKKTYKTFLYEEFADAWQTIKDLRSQGKRGLILCTRKADADFLKFAFGAVAVTADTANDYRELLDDPNVWLEREKPILMSVSPVLGIGFSITHDAFDYVFGWFKADNIGAKGLIQFLNRYRLPCDRHIFCDYSSNRFEGLTPDELYKNRLAKAKANQIISNEESFINKDDPSFHYRAETNWSLAYLRADLFVRLQQDIESVAYVRAKLSPEDRKTLLKDFNQALKAYRDQLPINIFEARNLSVTEYLALKDRQDLSESDRLAVAKFEIADWSCITPDELTLERVQRDKKGKKRKQGERIEMQSYPEIAKVKDKNSFEKQSKHGAGISHQDISHHALCVQTLEELGINEALDYALSGEVWGDDTPEIVTIADKIRANNKALKKLGINLQVSKGANNSRIFGGLLDYFGVKKKRSQKRIGGKVVSFHRVCDEDLELTKQDLIARLPRNIDWYGELIPNPQNPFCKYIYGCHTPFVNTINTKVCDSTQSFIEHEIQNEIMDNPINGVDASPLTSGVTIATTVPTAKKPITVLDFDKLVRDIHTNYEGILHSLEMQGDRIVARFGVQVAYPEFLELVA
jgi:hypothetical protein